MQFLSPFGASCGAADFKSQCEDFKVSEIGKFTPSGEGEHVWLWIEKTDTNTAWVAEELAKQSGIKLRDVSYAGRKDKVAVTQQWFSLYDPKRISDKVIFDIPNCNIYKKLRHAQKLRIGNLLGNSFEIRLRNFEGDFSKLEKRVDQIGRYGSPNYFGSQRFGSKLQNIPRAFKWVENGGGRLRREQRSIYLSTLRSFIFNRILLQRVEQKSWNKILLGELVQLNGSHSVFHADGEDHSLADLQLRCAEMDIHPSAILCGQSELQTTLEARDIELGVLEEFPKVSEFLIKEMSAARRTLRVLPQNVSVKLSDKDVIIKFSLTAGSYATVLLDQLVDINDLSR